jgi:hypothetical protein
MKIWTYALIKHAIDQADPIHLLEIGAPDDAYEPEIREIASRIGRCTTLEEIELLLHEVFVKWFDEQIAGPGEMSPEFRTMVLPHHLHRPFVYGSQAFLEIVKSILLEHFLASLAPNINMPVAVCQTPLRGPNLI